LEENGARQEERGDKIIEATMKQGLPSSTAFYLRSIKIAVLKEKREWEARNHASDNEESFIVRRYCSTLRLNGGLSKEMNKKERNQRIHTNEEIKLIKQFDEIII